MAYKFSIGQYRHSGSMVAEEGVTIDAGGLVVTGSVSLPAGEINTAELADAAVTTIKIADANVTTAKIADANVTTAKIADANVTAGKLATDAVETAKIKDANVTTAKIADAAVTNAKLQNQSVSFNGVSVALGASGSFSTTAVSEGTNLYYTDARARAAVSIVDAGGDGSFTYNSGSGVFTYTGPSAAETRAHFSAVDTNSIDMTYNSASGTIEGVLRLSGSALEVTTDGLRIASAAADAGLDWLAGGQLAVKTTGAVAIKNDFVAISSSIAGNGLGFVAGATGDVSVLNVNVDASSIEINADVLRVKGLGITNAMLSGGIENVKLVNSSLQVLGGNGLSAGGSVALGSSVTLDVQVDSNSLEINGSDQVALKSTIAGNRTFQNNVTIEGDLIVTGTTFSASVGSLLVEDAKITIADGAPALSASQGFEIGNNLASFVVGDGSSTNSAFVSSLELKASKFIGAVEGTLADSLQTLSANGSVTSSVALCDATSGAFTATLPTAVGRSGQFLKVKKSEGSANGVTVAASGSQTIDGYASIVLESPYAAVMLVSNGSNWFVF